MNKANILIVEDESIVALDIQTSLEEFGYMVTAIAKNSKQAMQKLQIKQPDIILMDINLGDGQNGIETAKQINLKYEIPIIYLTAFSNEKIIQEAIETNPIAYVVKPFKAEELNATLQLALYKTSKKEQKQEDTNLFKLGEDYYFDVNKEHLFFNEHPIKLSKNEKQLLKLLIESKGNGVSYNDIEFNLWPDSIINNETLRALVYRLRSKLNYNFIETVPSFGYRLSN